MDNNPYNIPNPFEQFYSFQQQINLNSSYQGNFQLPLYQQPMMQFGQYPSYLMNYNQNALNYQQNNYQPNQLLQSLQQSQNNILQNLQQPQNNILNSLRVPQFQQFQLLNQTFLKSYDIDPVQDTEDEINKWIQQRKKNYPGKRNNELKKQSENDDQLKKTDLSLLEQKLRKKLKIILPENQKLSRQRNKNRESIIMEIQQGEKIKQDQISQKVNKNFGKNNKKISNQINKIEDKPDVNDQTNESQLLLNFLDQIKNLESDDDEPDQRFNIRQEIQQDTPKTKSKQKQSKKLKLFHKNLIKINEKKKKIEEDECLKALIKEEQDAQKEIHQNEIQKIIQGLQTKKNEQDNGLNEFLGQNKILVDSQFKYRPNNLLATVLIDEIYKERCIALQAFQYIVKENFFQEDDSLFFNENDYENYNYE